MVWGRNSIRTAGRIEFECEAVDGGALTLTFFSYPFWYRQPLSYKFVSRLLWIFGRGS